jgi:phosphomannomutase/phosphoglucomutase
VLALPAARDKQLAGYAYVQMPIDPLLQVFRQQSLSSVRVDLRQGDGRGDLLLDSIGSNNVSTLNYPGDPIADSTFRIASAQVELPILVTRKLWLVLTLAIGSLGIGLFLWYARKVGWARVRRLFAVGKITPAPVLAQVPAQAPSLAAKVATLQAKAATPGKDAADRDTFVDRSIFRAYDIRGVVGKTLTKGVARLIGRAIGSEARARGLQEIAVARDGRLSGPDLVAALIEGLRSTGCDVIDIGAAPTPVLYFATFQLNTGSGVMVTGSHNPPDYNGFKIVLGGETLSEDAIQNLYARISESRFETGSGGLQSMNVQHEYLERIAGDVQVERKLKVVVDCGNGIAGAIAPAVLEAIGCEVTPLFCEVDGKFPNHHPDPSDARNLQDLILSVKQLKADVGVAFDGDGDRLGVVTPSGEIIYPDRLLMLFARDVLSRNPGAAIIYDVKCTGKLQPLILEAGGSPIMWKTGHSLIKSKMRQTGAELAGEMSGHFFFKERWYGFDDGIYAAARLLEIVASDIEGRSPQDVFDDLPKGISTPELKIEMEEGEHYRFVETFQQKSKFEGARITTIDGVRADWPDGWGLVRASNTTPVLVLRFDADNEDALLRIQAAFRAQLLALDPNLTLPF